MEEFVIFERAPLAACQVGHTELSKGKFLVESGGKVRYNVCRRALLRRQAVERFDAGVDGFETHPGDKACICITHE